MKKFKFFLIKTTNWYPRLKQIKKNFEIKADSLMSACKWVAKHYPNWEISMCWPVV